MKSDIILIDNQGKGFTEALKEKKKSPPTRVSSRSTPPGCSS